MNGKESFGARVVKFRRRKKLSQTALAASIDTSQTSISRIESSESPPADTRLLSRLAQGLDVPLSELIAGFPTPDALSAGRVEDFYAFCPNPFCDTNRTGRKPGADVFVSWASGERYPTDLLDEINFCEACGTELVKNCPSCKKLLTKAGTRYCVTCGTSVTDRPTSEEWARIRKIHPPPEPLEDDDIPF